MVSTEISRQRLSGANRPTRAPEERLAIRLRLRNRTWRRFEALAPRSPVRRRLIARAVERGVSAYNRRDWPAFGLAFHPRASFHPPAALVESGTADLIDAGERIVLLGEIVGEGAHSGVPIGAGGPGCGSTRREDRVPVGIRRPRRGARGRGCDRMSGAL